MSLWLWAVWLAAYGVLGYTIGYAANLVLIRARRRWGRWKLRQYVVHSGIDPVLHNTSLGDLSGFYLTRGGAERMAAILNKERNGPSASGTVYEVRAVRRDHSDELHNEVIVERAAEIVARMEDWTP